MNLISRTCSPKSNYCPLRKEAYQRKTRNNVSISFIPQNFRYAQPNKYTFPDKKEFRSLENELTELKAIESDVSLQHGQVFPILEEQKSYLV